MWGPAEVRWAARYQNLPAPQAVLVIPAPPPIPVPRPIRIPSVQIWEPEVKWQPAAPQRAPQKGAPRVSKEEKKADTYILSSQLFPKLRFWDSSCSSHQMNSTTLVGFNQ